MKGEAVNPRHVPPAVAEAQLHLEGLPSELLLTPLPADSLRRTADPVSPSDYSCMASSKSAVRHREEAALQWEKAGPDLGGQ